MGNESAPDRANLASNQEQASVEVVRLVEDDMARSRPQVARVLHVLGESLGDQVLNVTRLLGKCGLTRVAVAVPFRVDLGDKICDYLKKTYFEKALWFLFYSKATVSVVGELAGFSGPRSFRRTVDQLLGVSPQELEAKVGFLAAKVRSLGFPLHSRRSWRRLRKSDLSPAQAGELFGLVQELYPEPAMMWLEETSDSSAPETDRMNAALMEAFWELLVTLPKAEQQHFVRQVVHCRTSEFFGFLCRKSLEVSRTDSPGGVEVMRLAIDSLATNACVEELPALEALGLARLANAHRLASDLVGARRCLDDAREAWKRAEAGDALIEAEIDAHEATLNLLQGHLSEARKLCDRAIALCETISPCRLLAQCLNQRATIFAYAGDSPNAIQDLRAAEAVLAHLEEPRLRLTVAGNLALFYVLAGRVAKAEEQLARAWELCDEAGDTVIRQHLLWTKGLIRRARGELEQAAGAFEKARRGFEKLDQPGYQAMVALELALVRHEQCRFEDVIALAATAVPVLEHFQHTSGVSVALEILREAIGARQVTAEVLERVRTELLALCRSPSVNVGTVAAGSE